MSNKLIYSIVHCADTPNHKEFKASDIVAWHTDPEPLGNGWSKPGYNDVIERDGNVVNLIPYNENPIVDPWEIANGVRGINGRARHRCLIGRNQFTEAQFAALRNLLIMDVTYHPAIKIGGHGQFDPQKFKCPGFDVQEWLKWQEFPLKNIYRS